MKIIEQLINEALKETNINVPRQEINHFKFKIIDEILYSIKNSDVAINLKINGLVMSNFFKSCSYNEATIFNNNLLKRINKFYLNFLFKFSKELNKTEQNFLIEDLAKKIETEYIPFPFKERKNLFFIMIYKKCRQYMFHLLSANVNKETLIYLEKAK